MIDKEIERKESEADKAKNRVRETAQDICGKITTQHSHANHKKQNKTKRNKTKKATK